jgi:hypothetical protein
MTSALLSWARIGLFAAIMGSSVSVAVAQGDGRFGGAQRTNPTCGVNVWCPGGGQVFRPGGDAVRRHYDRPVWRGRNDDRPPRYRDDYRPYRPSYRPYRPRYYDGYGGSDVYLDFYAPSYRYYDPVPAYPRRYYRRGIVMSEAHIEWCYNRYRTYRERDNTYVPRRGVRAQCISPYS